MNSRAKAAACAEWLNKNTTCICRKSDRRESLAFQWWFYPADRRKRETTRTDDELIAEALRLGMPPRDCPCLEDLPGEVQLCDHPCKQPDDET